VASVRAKALLAAMWLALNRGDTGLVEMLCEESLALSRELDDKGGIAETLSGLGLLAMQRGDLEAACSLMEKALLIARKIGDKRRVASGLHDLAWVHLERGEYVRAHAMYEQCLADFRKLGDKIGIAASLHQLALVLFLSLDDQVRVGLLLEESRALWKEIGSQVGNALWSYLAGQVALCQDDTVQARLLLEESVVLFKKMGDRWHTAGSISSLARVEAVQSNYAAARALYEECVALCREVGYILGLGIASALEGLAGVVAAQGELVWAAQLWGAAEALREAMGTPIPPVYCAAYQRAVDVASTQLGEKAFTAAWAEGCTMTPEQALAAEGQPMLLTQAPAARPAAAYPDGLTAREVEVLRLLAQGLTSAHIAEQLTIGVVTVNFHVRSIYSKLGVTSRSAATRYALEHHLV
jgi:ATP/maltotriose-dependent transcriptional regulator MalT